MNPHSLSLLCPPWLPASGEGEPEEEGDGGEDQEGQAGAREGRQGEGGEGQEDPDPGHQLRSRQAS